MQCKERKSSLHQLRKRRQIGPKEPEVPSATWCQVEYLCAKRQRVERRGLEQGNGADRHWLGHLGKCHMHKILWASVICFTLVWIERVHPSASEFAFVALCDMRAFLLQLWCRACKTD
eukprot:540436-Pelagomonas_calceolata.AAC.1